MSFLDFVSVCVKNSLGVSLHTGEGGRKGFQSPQTLHEEGGGGALGMEV